MWYAIGIFCAVFSVFGVFISLAGIIHSILGPKLPTGQEARKLLGGSVLFFFLSLFVMSVNAPDSKPRPQETAAVTPSVDDIWGAPVPSTLPDMVAVVNQICSKLQEGTVSLCRVGLSDARDKNYFIAHGDFPVDTVAIHCQTIAEWVATLATAADQGPRRPWDVHIYLPVSEVSPVATCPVEFIG